jgi:hypothetical protein
MTLNLNFESLSLERVFVWILLLFLASVLALSIYSITQDHTIQYYYIDETEGKLYIKGDIDWAFDTQIRLDRSVSYSEAIELVNQMNYNLGCDTIIN